jgi:dihydropteroate synthase
LIASFGGIALDRPRVMAIVNVTPDSFSDGGERLDKTQAIDDGLRFVSEGADIVDVGGESTRPGATRPPVDEELRRAVPVVRELADAGAKVSVDTMRAEVAEACLAAGAAMVNDVSGGLADPAMAGVVAGAGVPFVVMHWRGPSSEMDQLATYRDVVADVRDELSARVESLVGQGVAREQLVLDPGLGFAKRAEHNWRLLAHLDQLTALGLPLLVGASRKRFLGTLLAGTDEAPRPPQQRDDATADAVRVVAAVRQAQA